MQTLKENMAEKKIYFVAYDAHVPIALCGCRGEEEYFILGPFSYGLANTFECRNFIRKNRIRECPKCRLEDILALVSFLTGEEFQEERRKDILGEFLPDREERENQELVTREELRQIDSFQKNHTYMDEQLLYDHIKEVRNSVAKTRTFPLQFIHLSGKAGSIYQLI